MVAITAMRRVIDAVAAGLTPGSTPTKAICGQRARKASIARAVAVLQGTTTMPAPRSISQAAIFKLRATISAAGRSPYGAQATSPT